VTDVYVIIGCENETVRSKTFKNNADPEFDTSGIFYRKRKDLAIVFSVSSSNSPAMVLSYF